jgi:hypothetical protein
VSGQIIRFEGKLGSEEIKELKKGIVPKISPVTMILFNFIGIEGMDKDFIKFWNQELTPRFLPRNTAFVLDPNSRAIEPILNTLYKDCIFFDEATAMEYFRTGKNTVPVSQVQKLIHEPYKPKGNEFMRLCPHCKVELEFHEVGNHACPVCSGRFRVLKNHRIVAYERFPRQMDPSKVEA